MCLAQGPQRNAADEAQTRSPSVLSQALYHWATALPNSDRIRVKDIHHEYIAFHRFENKFVKKKEVNNCA